jgi:hypothetical protein
VFQQGEIDSIGDRVALTQDPGDFSRLPVDDARQDQVQAAAGAHLLPQLAGVDPAAPPGKDVSGQGMELLDLEQAAPDAAAQFRFREVLEDEVCLEAAPEVPIGAGRTRFLALKPTGRFRATDAVTWPVLSKA